jgi:hypothetical protein
MKKLVFALSVVVLATSVSFAQDDKKQEPKKDKKEAKEAKEEKPTGGTRMAINEKGQPGTKKNTNSSSKTTEKKDEPK